MRRVAIFGNAGGGKSTLARALAARTGLPLHVIDMMRWRPGGAAVPEAEYLAAHAALLREERWIIDGFDNATTAWQRFAAADTLIHVDLPLPLHAWGVTTRLARGVFAAPEGWPEGAALWRSSISSYRVLLPCHRHLTPRYRELLREAAATKWVHHLTSRAGIAAFLTKVGPQPG
jgi:adenylate kinase family enzyme